MAMKIFVYIKNQSLCMILYIYMHDAYIYIYTGHSSYYIQNKFLAPDCAVSGFLTSEISLFTNYFHFFPNFLF